MMQATAFSVETPNLDTHDYLDMGRIHVIGWQTAYAEIIPKSFLNSLQVEPRQSFWRKRLEGSSVQDGCEELLVAKLDERVIGWIGYGHNRDSDAETTTGEIWGLYVDPAVWNRGAGCALVDSALNRLTDQLGYTRVCLWVLQDNVRARKFYEKQDFAHDHSDCNFKKVQIGGVDLAEIRYVHRVGKSAKQ